MCYVIHDIITYIRNVLKKKLFSREEDLLLGHNLEIT